MEIKVTVYSEDTSTGNKYLANEAYFTFVALDETGRPVSVPPLKLETETDKQLFSAGAQRREQRLRLKSQNSKE